MQRGRWRQGEVRQGTWWAGREEAKERGRREGRVEDRKQKQRLRKRVKPKKERQTGRLIFVVSVTVEFHFGPRGTIKFNLFKEKE